MKEIAIQDLLEAGVHFGHQARRWNPKMKKFIFTERNGIYIIDLQKTLACIQKAAKAVHAIAAKGAPILFVGTKAQAAAIIREEAERSGQFYVTNRWPGGMLTNFRTIRQSIKRLDHLEKMATDGTYEHLTKKEIQNLDAQRERLMYVLGGIRTMSRLPGLLIIVDTKKEKIAVNEANRLGIPVCALIDTNCDPDPVTYPIPGNDDALRSIKLILSALTDSILEGMQLYADKAGIAEKDSAIADAERYENERKFKRSRPVKAVESQAVETVEAAAVPLVESDDEEVAAVVAVPDEKDKKLKVKAPRKERSAEEAPARKPERKPERKSPRDGKFEGGK